MSTHAPPLAARSAAGGSELSRTVPSAVKNVLREPGRPLAGDVRERMEARFRRDFSGVRVHSDAMAARATRSVGAAAFTVGGHIAFGAGRYDVSTPRGLGTLAHELTHVVQQGQRKDVSAFALGGPAAAEHAADSNAQAFGAGAAMDTSSRVDAPVLQRQNDLEVLNGDQNVPNKDDAKEKDEGSAGAGSIQAEKPKDEGKERALNAFRTTVRWKLKPIFAALGKEMRSDSQAASDALFTAYDEKLKKNPQWDQIAEFQKWAPSQVKDVASEGAKSASSALTDILKPDGVGALKREAQAAVDAAVGTAVADGSEWQVNRFENEALRVLEPVFEALYGENPSGSEVRTLILNMADRAAEEYGRTDSPLRKKVRADFQTEVIAPALVPTKKKLDAAEAAYRRRRGLTEGGIAAGGVAGGLIGYLFPKLVPKILGTTATSGGAAGGQYGAAFGGLLLGVATAGGIIAYRKGDEFLADQKKKHRERKAKRKLRKAQDAANKAAANKTTAG